jgi:hypothetical protein
LFNGVLQATAGDFDGDQKMDLVVSESVRRLTSTGSGQVLDEDQRGSIHVFFDALDGGRVLSLTSADRSLTGDFEFDGFGVLSSTPGMDLDGDFLDDLVVGAPGADVTTTEVIPAGGKAFVIYGASSRAALPANATELGTRSFTGAGFFLVDEGTGRPTLFRDAPGEDEPLFLLDNGADAWYRFTTLGDGMPGNSIRILPGAIDGFLAPQQPAGSSAAVGTAQRAGNFLLSQPFVDGAVGSMFVGDAFSAAGRVTGWSVYSGVYDTAVPRYVTPLIFKDTSDGRL